MLVTVPRGQMQLLLKDIGKTIKHDLKTKPRGIPIINWNLNLCSDEAAARTIPTVFDLVIVHTVVFVAVCMRVMSSLVKHLPTLAS